MNLGAVSERGQRGRAACVLSRRGTLSLPRGTWCKGRRRRYVIVSGGCIFCLRRLRQMGPPPPSCADVRAGVLHGLRHTTTEWAGGCDHACFLAGWLVGQLRARVLESSRGRHRCHAKLFVVANLALAPRSSIPRSLFSAESAACRVRRMWPVGQCPRFRGVWNAVPLASSPACLHTAPARPLGRAHVRTRGVRRSVRCGPPRPAPDTQGRGPRAWGPGGRCSTCVGVPCRRPSQGPALAPAAPCSRAALALGPGACLPGTAWSLCFCSGEQRDREQNAVVQAGREQRASEHDRCCDCASLRQREEQQGSLCLRLHVGAGLRPDSGRQHTRSQALAHDHHLLLPHRAPASSLGIVRACR